MGEGLVLITVYRKQLFENLRNLRFILNTKKIRETQKFPCEKHEKITRYFGFKKLIPAVEKEKRCLPAGKKHSNICLEKISETLKYSNYTSSKQPKVNFKLEKIIDIFYSTNIPPTIKSKRNVIVVIENSKRINEGRITCPDCLKGQIFEELKRKVAANLKELIVLIRKRLLRGLVARKEFIFEEKPKPGILITDDLAAPFPEMDTDPVPVFSFAEDKPQERTKCKDRPKENEDTKKSSPLTPQEIFYEWGKEALLNDEKIEPSPEHETSTHTEKPICHPPLFTKDPSKFPLNLNPLRQELEDIDYAPKMNYNKNSSKSLLNRDNNSYNKGKSSNHEESEKNVQVINQCNSPNQPNPSEVTNVEEDISLSTLDLSNPSVVIIPVLKPKKKGKRNIIIKLKNVPDFVDVIKIRSIMTSICNACEVKKYSNYFLKNRSKPPPNNKQTDLAKNKQRQIRNMSYCMTCPNKHSKPSTKLFPGPYLEESNIYDDRNPYRRSPSDRMKNNSNLRCYKKNDCFFDE